MNIQETIDNLPNSIAVYIEKVLDQNDNVYYEVSDKSDDLKPNYFGKGKTIEEALRNYITDLGDYAKSN